MAGLLLVLGGAACSTPPEVRSGDPRAGHEFVLREDFRGQVRKIAVKFEPGGVLQWELVRSDDPERNKSLFASLDYGESPECMDQSFPSGVPERPGPGQVISMTLHYGREGEPDPIVPGVVIRWFQKKGRSFSELTEQEAEEHSRKADQGEKH